LDLVEEHYRDGITPDFLRPQIGPENTDAFAVAFGDSAQSVACH
jgi:hypothetical protein